MYHAKDRGKSLAIAALLPYLGPALGPIVGGLAARHLWWPWLFWILSIFDVACLVLGYYVLKETYAPVLLRGREATIATLLVSQNHQASYSLTQNLLTSLRQPVLFLIFRPVIAVLALSAGVDFGIYTLVLSTFARLWTTRYDESATTASLHYISIALGAFLSAQAGGWLMDVIWRRMKANQPEELVVPENRVPSMLIGLIPGVAGLFWYAWAGETVSHWLMVDIAVFIFTCGTFMFSQALMAYLIDEFSSTRAASANAATRLPSYVLGFIFPIFAPNLEARLGFGWGNSVLGFVILAIGLPTIALLWFWGSKLRAVGMARNMNGLVES